jgi:hypothetical protein
MPGVNAYNDQAVKVQDEGEFFDAIAALERLRLRFEGTDDELMPGQEDLLSEVFLHITDIRRLARFYNRPVQFTINAQAVTGETEVNNLIISRNRADYVMGRLILLGLKETNDILVNGNGSKPIYEADSVVVVRTRDDARAHARRDGASQSQRQAHRQTADRSGAEGRDREAGATRREETRDGESVAAVVERGRSVLAEGVLGVASC